jgi:hypothetical protein
MQRRVVLIILQDRLRCSLSHTRRLNNSSTKHRFQYIDSTSS